MSKYSELSEADSIIMEILWREGECGSSEILKEIESVLGWSRQTVRTYLVRLAEKGMVGTKVHSKRNFTYFPIVSKEEYAADKAGSLMNKYYGSVPHLLAGLLRDEELSEKELDELENMIRMAREKKEAE